MQARRRRREGTSGAAFVTLVGQFPRIFRPRRILRLQSMAEGFVRPPRQQVGAGSACRQSAARPQIRRIRELQSMVPGFVFYSAAASGSRPCRPAASGSRPCRPAAASACRLSLPAKNLEALIYGRQIRVLSGGSNRVQAQPAGSKWQSARPARLTSGWGADRCGGGRGGRSRTGFPPPRGARPRRRCTRPRRSARAPRRSAER